MLFDEAGLLQIHLGPFCRLTERCALPVARGSDGLSSSSGAMPLFRDTVDGRMPNKSSLASFYQFFFSITLLAVDVQQVGFGYEVPGKEVKW